jgi:hypothetical protein
VRDLLTGHPEQAQKTVQDGGRVGRWLGRVGVEPAQVDKQHLAETLLAGEEVCGVDGQLGLADPGHPFDRGDHHRPTTGGAVMQCLTEPVEFGAAAGEPDQVRRQRVLDPALGRRPGLPTDNA